MLRRIVKWTVIVLAAVFVAAQFYQPARTNPATDPARTIDSQLPVPPEVSAIFKRACSDCHSHETKWPWYSYVTPLSWFIANDVAEGRSKLNFSDWASYNQSRSAKKLEEICDEVSRGEMPLKAYVTMHSEAKLSAAEVQLICDWVNTQRGVQGDAKEAEDKRDEDRKEK